MYIREKPTFEQAVRDKEDAQICPDFLPFQTTAVSVSPLSSPFSICFLELPKATPLAFWGMHWGPLGPGRMPVCGLLDLSGPKVSYQSCLFSPSFLAQRLPAQGHLRKIFKEGSHWTKDWTVSCSHYPQSSQFPALNVRPCPSPGSCS